MAESQNRYLLDSLLASAIHFETASAQLYREAISRVGRGTARDLLRTLAEEEERHRKKLEDLRENSPAEEIIRSGEDAELPEIPADVTFEQADNDIPSMALPREILDIARKREEAAYAFYAQLAGQTETPIARQAFAFLASEEERHIELVEKLNSQLSQT